MEKTTTRNKNITWLTSKGIHIVKVGKCPHTNILPKPEIVRRKVYKCRDTGDTLAIKRPTTGSSRRGAVVNESN